MARIYTTPTVRIALWALRIYLLILLTLIGMKFIRIFSHQPPPAPSGSAIVAPSPKGASAPDIKP